MNGLSLALVGATSSVGRAVLDLLSLSSAKFSQIVPLVPKSDLGKEVVYGGSRISVIPWEDYSFSQVDLALFVADLEISRQYVDIALSSGCLVMDATSLFLGNSKVPLVFPEIVPDDLSKCIVGGIIALPSPLVTQISTALFPLHQAVNINRIVVSSYQSVSTVSREAMTELDQQTKNMFMNKSPVPQIFAKQIAYNCIPQVGEFTSSGFTVEEERIEVELKRVLGSSVNVMATCVVVPVFVGAAMSLNVEFRDSMSVDDAFSLFEEAPGVLLLDRRENGGYMTHHEVACDESVYVSRLRADRTVRNGLAMWVVADHLQSSASNIVQIIEKLSFLI